MSNVKGVNIPQFVGKGQCHGVNLVARGRNDDHTLVQIFTEDDGAWDSQMLLSSFWLSSLISVLQSVEKQLETYGVKGTFGYTMPSDKMVDLRTQLLENREED